MTDRSGPDDDHMAYNVVHHARALAKDPQQVTALATPDDGSDALHVRELDAILAGLIEGATQRLDPLLFARGPEHFPLIDRTPPGKLSIDVGPRAFRSELASRQGEALSTFMAQLLDFLAEPANAPVVQRVAHLLDLLPPGPAGARGAIADEPDEHHRRQFEPTPDGGWRTSDLGLVAEEIDSGLRTQAAIQPAVANACVERLLLDAPELSPDQVREVLGRSVNLLVIPARLRAEQMETFFAALTLAPSEEGAPIPPEIDLTSLDIHPGNLVYHPGARRITYRKRPEDFVVRRVVEPEISGDDRGDREAVGEPEELTERIGDMTSDVRGLDDPQGCPARIPTGAENTSTIQRQWLANIDGWNPWLGRAFPSAAASLPAHLSAALSETNQVGLAIEGVHDVRIVVAETQAGRATIDDPDGALERLRLTHDDGVLHITSAAAEGDEAPDLASLPAVVIRCRTVPFVAARGNRSVEVHGGKRTTIDASVGDGMLVAAGGTQRVTATAGASVLSLGPQQLDLVTGRSDVGAPQVLAVTGWFTRPTISIMGPAAEDVVTIAGEMTETHPEIAELVERALARARHADGWQAAVRGELPSQIAAATALHRAAPDAEWHYPARVLPQRAAVAEVHELARQRPATARRRSTPTPSGQSAGNEGAPPSATPATPTDRARSVRQSPGHLGPPF